MQKYEFKYTRPGYTRRPTYWKNFWTLDYYRGVKSCNRKKLQFDSICVLLAEKPFYFMTDLGAKVVPQQE